ncbi:MAG: ABC transporter permease [Firmicutes bacterium]|nr:ABC transporter permease [Bacillota bacterium]
MTPSRMIRRFITEYLWILKGQMYALRSQWFWYVVFLSFSPLTYVFFLWIYGGAQDATTRLYIVTGAVANGAVSSAMLSLGQSIGRLRDQNALEYYASLPILKVSFILALASRGVILSLPSSAIILVVGTLGLGLPTIPQPALLVLAYLIGAYSLAGLGSVIGFYTRDSETVGLVTQIVGPLIVLFAPVYVPLKQLPGPLQATAQFLPTTYVASCLRHAVSGSIGPEYWYSLTIVLVWSLGGLALSLLGAGWRGSQE